MIALINFALGHTRTVVLILILLLIAGFATYVAIPKESDPDINIPIIYVSMSLEGISPEDAERCFAACLDYVFYTSTSLVPRRVLDVYKFSKALFPRDRVPLEMLAKMCLGNTPNGAVPSDHFPMAVVFAL